jgi:hypothetical protein
VWLALSVGSAPAASPAARGARGAGLALTRADALFGAPALLSAAAGVREGAAAELAAVVDGYPSAEIEDTGAVGVCWADATRKCRAADGRPLGIQSHHL